MTTHKHGYLMLTSNLIDNVDPTKQLKISLTNISPSTVRTLTVPNANTTMVGTDTTDTLTNKTIQGSTNIVDANNLKTTGTSVNISSAVPPTSGQVLTAATTTTATWQTPPVFNVYLNNLGTVTNPSVTSLKQWYGHATTSTGTIIFDVTINGSDGTAIFTNLSTSYLFTSCRKNTTSNNAIPFSSIQTVDPSNKTVTVNVQTGNNGSILIGGSYNGMQANASSCDVYLYIIGV